MATQAIAVDWSGRARGASRFIWMAVARGNRLVELSAGRDRASTIAELIRRLRAEPRTAVGLDFAFSFPAWYCARRGWKTAGQAWTSLSTEAEGLLAACEPPFWGRAGTRAQTAGDPLRETERRLRPRPKSVFQIGGAGAVGTGSLRGMPHLAELAAAGACVWPFEPARWPLVLEIYPRAFVPVGLVKSRAGDRRRHLERLGLTGAALTARAAESEDAFDAAVSAVAMAAGRAGPQTLPATSPAARMEGWIWTPGDAVRDGAVAGVTDGVSRA